jgi:RNA processing factor Prp31
MARKLAAKVSLAARIDALADESLGNQMGIEARALLEGVAKAESERAPKRLSSGNPQYGNQRKSSQFKFKR